MEQDFADKGWDYRDRYRPGGGPSRMTVRRLLLLVDGLDQRTSRFWCAVFDRNPMSLTDSLVADLWELWAGKDNRHPIRQTRAEVREQEAAALARERRKKQIKAAERRRKARVAGR